MASLREFDIAGQQEPNNKQSENVEVDITAHHRCAERPQYHKGNARDLAFLQDSSVDLIVTSPPYWQRRDYGHPQQLGQESTPESYIDALIETMAGWVSVLRPHASILINLGDTYRNGFLMGIPAQFEVAARKAGWNVANHIVWTKSVGRPEPQPYRLANRHEAIFHLTQAQKPNNIFFDLYALSKDLGRTANPTDVWDLFPARSKSDHMAPFPPELARRAIVVACPERICTACSRPFSRRLEPSTELDATRPQSVRAMELFRKHNLTEEHLAAIRAVGISDAGKGRQLQNGSGKNAREVQRLATEAKEVLGGYFREFTFAPKQQIGWITCQCNAPTVPGTVLDPFMGSGTTMQVAQELGRNAIGIDLIVSKQLEGLR